MIYKKSNPVFLFCHGIFFLAIMFSSLISVAQSTRQKISINNNWKFFKGDPQDAQGIFYDVRPNVTNRNDNVVADTRADQSNVSTSDSGLKKWILPSANDFIKDETKHYLQPNGNPASTVSFVQNSFDDSKWQQINLPHDWAINGPFYEGNSSVVGGGMGRLPIQGVGWYRKKLNFASADKGKLIYLDIDGAMSYAMVWLNGNLVGGWPYGYNSFRLDLTPYIKFDGDNQLAIRLDNPNYSSRWYPGAGIYRNVWITKVNPVHVAQWGTFVRTRNVSASSATVDLTVQIENKSSADQNIKVVTEVFALIDQFKRTEGRIAAFPNSSVLVLAGQKQQVENSVII
jgi:beta-galactosidase